MLSTSPFCGNIRAIKADRLEAPMQNLSIATFAAADGKLESLGGHGRGARRVAVKEPFVIDTDLVAPIEDPAIPH